MAKQVDGGERLGEAVKDAAASRGWRQSDLEGRSRDAVADHSVDRTRVGLSERTWQDIWRGKKTAEMDAYSYFCVDSTFEWPNGTARALHHDRQPPTADRADLAVLRDEVEVLRKTVEHLEDRLDEERRERVESLGDVTAQVRGLLELLPTILGRLGRRDT